MAVHLKRNYKKQSLLWLLERKTFKRNRLILIYRTQLLIRKMFCNYNESFEYAIF